MNGAAAVPSLELDRVRQRLRAVGLVGIGLSALGALLNADQFFRSYLLAYLFWFGIALGCLPLMMLHHQSGGAWGLAIRRLLEAGTRTLPLMAALFLPLVLGLSRIYLWARPEAVQADELLQHKHVYLNVPFFLFRAVFYFAVWIAIAGALNRWSLEQDRTGDVKLTRRMQVLSGPGIVLYVLTITFASVDWVMSLDPHWYSTIFGVLWVVSQGLTAFCFVIAVLVALSDREPFAHAIRPDIYQDLGKLLLAFVMVWAYFAFSQFLIIWSGNLTEEIPWYIHRLQGGWQWIGLLLILAHFVLPFLLLLSRDLKRNARLLAWVAMLVMAMRFVDLFWIVAPNFHEGGFHLHWMDVFLPVGLGGIWIAAFLGRVAERPLLPLNDPYLPESLGHGTARG